MSEGVRCSRFSSGTSPCPGDRLNWPKGGSVVTLKETGLTACPAAAVREGESNWMSEWVSEWVIKWRAKAACSLTDRGKLQRSASICHTDLQPRPVVAPLASRAQPDAGLSGWMIASLGKYFIRYNTKSWFLNYHTIFRQITVIVVSLEVEASHDVRIALDLPENSKIF